MKILHIIPTLDQGGAERLLVDLCDHAGAEFEHVIVTLFGPIFFTPRRAAVRSIDFPRRLTFTNFPRGVRALLRLRAMVAQENPDIVHGWLYYGNLVTLALRGLAPRIVWSIHHTTFVPVRATRLVRLANRLCQLASRWVPDRIVYCAQTARKLHESYGYAAKKSAVIYNGISFAKFARSDQWRRDRRAQLGLADDQLAVGHFARFDAQKNFGFACEAIARAKPGLGRFKLLFAGRNVGPSNPELATLLRKHGLLDDTVLLGPVDDMQEYVNAVDIVVLGSSYGEALPIVLIEAAACERAIVTTNLGDISMLGLSAGSIVPPDDVESFARAIVHEAAALRDGSSAERRAIVAARLRGQFSIEACAKAYEGIYQGLQGSRGPSGTETRAASAPTLTA